MKHVWQQLIHGLMRIRRYVPDEFEPEWSLLWRWAWRKRTGQ